MIDMQQNKSRVNPIGSFSFIETSDNKVYWEMLDGSMFVEKKTLPLIDRFRYQKFHEDFGMIDASSTIVRNIEYPNGVLTPAGNKEVKMVRFDGKNWSCSINNTRYHFNDLGLMREFKPFLTNNTFVKDIIITERLYKYVELFTNDAKTSNGAVIKRNEVSQTQIMTVGISAFTGALNSFMFESKNRLYVCFSGTSSSTGRPLKTQFHYHHHNSVTSSSTRFDITGNAFLDGKPFMKEFFEGVVLVGFSGAIFVSKSLDSINTPTYAPVDKSIAGVTQDLGHVVVMDDGLSGCIAGKGGVIITTNDMDTFVKREQTITTQDIVQLRYCAKRDILFFLTKNNFFISKDKCNTFIDYTSLLDASKEHTAMDHGNGNIVIGTKDGLLNIFNLSHNNPTVNIDSVQIKSRGAYTATKCVRIL